jgi:hypothetical protein
MFTFQKSQAYTYICYIQTRFFFINFWNLNKVIFAKVEFQDQVYLVYLGIFLAVSGFGPG